MNEVTRCKETERRMARKNARRLVCQEDIASAANNSVNRYDNASQPRSKLEAFRFSLEMSSDRFAELLGISRQLLSFYEKKEISPLPSKLELMKKNAALNGIDLNDEILIDLVQPKLAKVQRTLERQKARIEKKDQ